ncbi:MAG: acyl-CoA synthetase, partial [Pseudomonadota bacterium]|nr:acyl-CoA synthetase [Pseudomonadota bacterium]
MRTTPAEVIDRYRRQGWWTDTTVDDLFRAATAAEGGRPAVIDPSNRAALGLGEPQRLGYAELDSRVDAIAAQLLGLGLGRGDIVLV